MKPDVKAFRTGLPSWPRSCLRRRPAIAKRYPQPLLAGGRGAATLYIPHTHRARVADTRAPRPDYARLVAAVGARIDDLGVPVGAVVPGVFESVGSLVPIGDVRILGVVKGDRRIQTCVVGVVRHFDLPSSTRLLPGGLQPLVGFVEVADAA